MKKKRAFDVEWKSRKTEPPLQDTYSARHLPNGRLTIFGMRKIMKELADRKSANKEEVDKDESR